MISCLVAHGAIFIGAHCRLIVTETRILTSERETILMRLRWYTTFWAWQRYLKQPDRVPIVTSPSHSSHQTGQPNLTSFILAGGSSPPARPHKSSWLYGSLKWLLSSILGILRWRFSVERFRSDIHLRPLFSRIYATAWLLSIQFWFIFPVKPARFWACRDVTSILQHCERRTPLCSVNQPNFISDIAVSSRVVTSKCDSPNISH